MEDRDDSLDEVIESPWGAPRERKGPRDKLKPREAREVRRERWNARFARWFSRRRLRAGALALVCVVVALALGAVAGELGEPAVIGAAASATTVTGLHLDSRPITDPDLARVHALSGPAWSNALATTLVVHVVNDGSATLRLRGGTLTGSYFTASRLTPAGGAVLAPGQSGALTANVTMACDVEASASPGQVVHPLVADVSVSAGGAAADQVRLTVGDKSTDVLIVGQTCLARPVPLASSYVITQDGAPAHDLVLRVTFHNPTALPFVAGVAFSDSIAGPASTQAVGPGATVVITVPVAAMCAATKQIGAASPDLVIYQATPDRGYHQSMDNALGQDPRIMAAC